MTVESRRALGSRYELQGMLGSGAMGQVWRALDRTTGRQVAAKLLRPEYVRDPAILTRFIQERSILMSLRHPNIVEVHDLVVEGDDLAIVMDLIEGPTLALHLQRQGTMAPADGVDIVVFVLDALSEAHRMKALHRDVKPDNVMLARLPAGGTQVKLTDFSIARLAQESTVQATGLLGTPSYMPPELFAKGEFSTASDVYAAGVMLYELLAGRTPFAGAGTAHTVGFRHLTAAPPALPVPQRLWSALATMLAKDPTVRLTAAATAQQLRELRPVLTGVKPLPVQPEPQAWDDAPAVSAGPIHVAAGAAVDPGATNLHAALDAAPAAPIARPGELRAAVGTTATENGDNRTQLGTPTEREGLPTLTPHVELPTAARRLWKMIALIGSGVLVLVAGLLVLTGAFRSPKHVGRPGGSSAPVASGGAVTDQGMTAATGFAESASATYNAAQGAVTATFKLTLPSDHGGSVLLVLPPITDSDACTAVTWAGDMDQAPISLSGQNASTPIACGWSVTTTAGQPGATVTATVPTASQPGTDRLQQWLTSVDTRTTAALKSMQGTDFAAQRLAGISVVPLRPLPSLGFDRKIPFEILPTWLGQRAPSRSDPLYATDSDGTFAGPPTSAWTAVTGSTDIGDAVNAAQNVSVAGGEVTTGSRPGDAQFTVKINSELQAPFTITVAGPPS